MWIVGSALVWDCFPVLEELDDMASLVGQSERIAGYQAAPSERLNPQPRFLTCVGFRHSTGTPYADKRLMLLAAHKWMPLTLTAGRIIVHLRAATHCSTCQPIHPT